MKIVNFKKSNMTSSTNKEYESYLKQRKYLQKKVQGKYNNDKIYIRVRVRDHCHYWQIKRCFT